MLIPTIPFLLLILGVILALLGICFSTDLLYFGEFLILVGVGLIVAILTIPTAKDH